MNSMRTVFFAATLALSPALGGCFFFGGNPQSTGSGSTDTGGGTTEQDVAQYDSLQAQLEGRREVFLQGGASELAGVANRLFWLEFPTDSPTVHSYDATTSQRIDYKFSIGGGDKYNYRASEQLVVTAEPTGDSVILHAYAVGKASTSAGDLTLPAPGDGTRWWAYAPDQGDVYYVTTTSGTTLWKWTPGSDAPVQLFNLEDTGAQIGEFQDFGVDHGILIFIESGRIWSLDIAAQKSTWLGNKTEASSASWDQEGVLFSTAKGPFFYGYASKMLSDIGAAIQSSGFHLNATFASAHVYNQDLTRYHDVVGYKGQSGVFTYDMAANKVTPILLDARDNSVVYRYPVILDDGSFFVQGLTSDDGAVGFDGPVYRVNAGL